MASAQWAWEVQHTKFPTSVNPDISFSPVNENVCWGINSTSVFDPSATPHVLRTTNGGATWDTLSVQGSAGLEGAGIAAIDSIRAWITLWDRSGLTSGAIFKTTNGGKVWLRDTTAFRGPGGHPEGIHVFDPNNGLAFGDPRSNSWEIYTTTDGGGHWTQVPAGNIPAPTPADFGLIYSESKGNTLWFGTYNRSIYKSTDRGMTWSAVRNVLGSDGVGVLPAFKDTLNGLCCSCFNNDGSNRIFKTTDGGATWTSLSPASIPATPSAFFVSYAPGLHAYVILSGSNLGRPVPTSPGSMYSTDDGSSWKKIDALPHGPASFTSSGPGWSSGTGDTIVYRIDPSAPAASGQWVAQPTGLTPGQPSWHVLQFAAVDTNIVWGVRTRNSEFIRTTNGGSTWSHDTVTGAAGLFGSDITAVDSSTAWVVMQDPSARTSGGVFRTTDGGADWVKQTTAFPSAGGVPTLIHFFDHSNGLACGYPNGGYMEFYTTTDGGDHWTRVPSSKIPSPSLTGAAFMANAPSVVNNTLGFCYGSSLFRSTDKGMTWAVINSVFPGTAGFGLAFRDSLHGLACTADYPPIQNWVSRTTDGGQSWLPINPPMGLSTYFLEPAGNKGAYVLTSITNIGGPVQFVPGSAYSLDNGNSWVPIDSLGHGQARFVSDRVGWSSGETDSVYKWTGNRLLTSVSQLKSNSPLDFKLEQNYPNPFNPATTIQYGLPHRSTVSLAVYNTLGQQIAILVHGDQEAGLHEVRFDGLGLASGVYFYRLRAGDFIQTKRLLLVR